MPDASFEQAVLTHLGAGYSLARWLLRNDPDAEDALQEASLRAHRFWPAAQPVQDPRAWFLRIVRNVCASQGPRLESLDEPAEIVDSAPLADERLISAATAAQVGACIEHLPPIYREVLVLRELEGLSYAEIAVVTESPEGTVMSRLLRGRALLRRRLTVLLEGVRP